MAELFGAPLGEIAAEQLTRQEYLGALQAQHALGEIEKQPAQRQLIQAQARKTSAEASTGELKVQQAQRAMRLEQDFQASRRLQAGVAAQGRLADVTDLPPGVRAGTQTLSEAMRQTSLADPLREKYNWMRNNGGTTEDLADLAKEIAATEEKEAIAGYRNTQARQGQQKLQEGQAQQMGGMARSAAASSGAYSQFYMALAGQNSPMAKWLTGDYTTDKPRLEAYANSTETALQQSQEARAQAKLELEEKRAKASNAHAYAGAALAKARKEKIDLQVEAIKKAGGEGSPEMVALKETQTAAKMQQMEKERLVMHPALKLSSSTWVEGKTYTLADGSVGRVMKDPKTGEWAVDVILPPLKRMTPRTPDEVRAARAKTAANALKADDNSEED